LQWIHQNSYLLDQENRLTAEEKHNKLACGIFRFQAGDSPSLKNLQGGDSPHPVKEAERAHKQQDDATPNTSNITSKITPNNITVNPRSTLSYPNASHYAEWADKESF
jgi:hypothetical protein